MKKVLIITLFSFLLSACGFANTQRDKPLVMATLFPQFDIARQLAGDLIDVEFLLPAGVDAHTYEPTPRRVIDILSASMLIYTGDAMEPWVSRLIAPRIHRDLSLLDLSQNATLIQANRPPITEGDDLLTEDEVVDDSIMAFELVRYLNNNEPLAYVHGDHWHGRLPSLPLGQSMTLSANITSKDGQTQALDSSGNPNGLAMSIAPNMPRDIIGFENLHNRVQLTALKIGLTQVVFHWLVNGNIRFSTPAINIQVGENTSAYGLYDPHIWMDPINILQMVDDIQHAFIDLLPENALYFTEKADAYKRAIEDVHERYRYVFANSEITTIMHGGHNVFGYLTNRYNLGYVNPYRGFSPDAEPTPQAIVTMIERMRAENITHLFSEALIDPKVADLLFRETGAQILYVYAGENIPSQLLNEGFSFIDLLDSNLEQFKIGLRYRGNESAH